MRKKNLLSSNPNASTFFDKNDTFEYDTSSDISSTDGVTSRTYMQLDNLAFFAG